MPAPSRLSCTKALLLLAITSSFFLQVTLSAPANFATVRHAVTEEQQEQAHIQERGLWPRSITLARTRNLAALASRNASTSVAATTTTSSSTALPSSSTSSSSSSDEGTSSSISLTRSSSEEDIATSTTSSQVQSTSSSATTTSISSSSSSSSSSSGSTSSSSSSSQVPSASSSVSSSSSSSSSSIPPSSSSSSSSSSVTTSAPTSSIATTSTRTSSAATSTVSPGKVMTGCSCGYRLSSFDNQYLRSHFSIDFRKYSSVSQIQSAGITVANGYQIGNTAPDGTYAYGMASNVKFGGDGVHLIVPGNQTAGGQVTGAQLIYNNNGRGMTKMYAEADIRVDATPGTCQAFWTFTNDLSASSDEQDMEVIAASLLTDSEVHEAGLQLTNHAPDKSGNKDHRTVPFPSDPSVGFHKYTIAWDRSSVSYYFDGQLLDGPTADVSQNPSNLLLNHWASGNIAFFGAPLPNRTVTMRVRSMRLYYETDFDSSLPSGCTESNVCVI